MFDALGGFYVVLMFIGAGVSGAVASWKQRSPHFWMLAGALLPIHVMVLIVTLEEPGATVLPRCRVVSDAGGI